MLPKLKEFILNISKESISKSRQDTLQPLVSFIQKRINQQEKVRLNFICTHNSRRSHLAQVWAQTMAYYFRIETVFCYSGGTTVTALFPNVAETLSEMGFNTTKLTHGKNPIYSIKYAENELPVIGFSKEWHNEFNPKNEFAAILTCSQADEDCPFIPGAKKRISIPFEDPKIYDNTLQQSKKYEERSIQIASELFYVFSKIKSQHDSK